MYVFILRGSTDRFAAELCCGEYCTKALKVLWWKMFTGKPRYLNSGKIGILCESNLESSGPKQYNTRYFFKGSINYEVTQEVSLNNFFKTNFRINLFPYLNNWVLYLSLNLWFYRFCASSNIIKHSASSANVKTIQFDAGSFPEKVTFIWHWQSALYIISSVLYIRMGFSSLTSVVWAELCQRKRQ